MATPRCSACGGSASLVVRMPEIACEAVGKAKAFAVPPLADPFCQACAEMLKRQLATIPEATEYVTYDPLEPEALAS